MAESTTIRERTDAIARSGIIHISGFVIGQALQSFVSAFGEDGFTVIPSVIKVDMYNAAGWINVILNIINLLLIIYLFKVYTMKIEFSG